MILLSSAVRVYLATEPMNLRKSFEGLQNAVRCVIQKDPLSGHVFAFINRRKDHVKLLLWTRGGFTIVQKRLERGVFTFDFSVVKQGCQAIELGADELAMLLEGIDTTGARRSRRFVPGMVEVAQAGAAAS